MLWRAVLMRKRSTRSTLKYYAPCSSFWNNSCFSKPSVWLPPKHSESVCPPLCLYVMHLAPPVRYAEIRRSGAPSWTGPAGRWRCVEFTAQLTPSVPKLQTVVLTEASHQDGGTGRGRWGQSCSGLWDMTQKRWLVGLEDVACRGQRGRFCCLCLYIVSSSLHILTAYTRDSWIPVTLTEHVQAPTSCDVILLSCCVFMLRRKRRQKHRFIFRRWI